MDKSKIFENVYLNIISEQTVSDKQNQAPIDDLTKQNITTIAQTNQTPEQESDIQAQDFNEQQENSNQESDDGWDENVEQELSDVLDDLDSLSYEIKNCKRGSFTGANTKEELAQYIKQLAERLNEKADALNN